MGPIISLSCPVSEERVKSSECWGILLFKEAQVPLKHEKKNNLNTPDKENTVNHERRLSHSVEYTWKGCNGN